MISGAYQYFERYNVLSNDLNIMSHFSKRMERGFDELSR